MDLGVPKDDVVACAWFNLALKEGYDGVRKEKDSIMSRMSIIEIIQVQKITKLLVRFGGF